MMNLFESFLLFKYIICNKFRNYYWEVSGVQPSDYRHRFQTFGTQHTVAFHPLIQEGSENNPIILLLAAYSFLSQYLSNSWE